MKTIAPVFVLAACTLLAGCHSSSPTSANSSAVRSERQYAEQREARAQDLYKTGQASSLEEARAQATAESNQEWYAAAKAKEQRIEQENFEKDFKKSQAATR